MLYVVYAKDGTDSEAPARRAAVRAEHLEGATVLQEDGRLVTGGALLDEAGAMIGSMMILDMPSLEDATALVEADIYKRAGVWREIEIMPYRKAL